MSRRRDFLLLLLFIVPLQARAFPAYAPMIHQDDILPTVVSETAHNLPSFPRRTLFVDFHVEKNGVDEDFYTFGTRIVVLYEADVQRRRLRSLETIPFLFGIDEPTEIVFAEQGDADGYLRILPGDGGILRFGSTSIAVGANFQNIANPHVEPDYSIVPIVGLQDWDVPLIVDDVERLRRRRSTGREWRNQWLLSGISAQWKSTDVVLFDGHVATGPSTVDHFVVTLDRIGWSTVDEIVVGALTRRRVRRAGLAAAVPEPATWTLLAAAIPVGFACSYSVCRLRPTQI